MLRWLILTAVLALPRPVSGWQNPGNDPFPPPALSIGQPPRLRVTWGPSIGYDFDSKETVGRIYLDVAPRGAVPQFGVDHLIGEMWLGMSGNVVDGAVAAHVRLVLLRLGLEYNFHESELVPVIALQFAARRGGLFRRGEELRFDYRPTQDQWSIGIMLTNPFKRYRPTRPRMKYVRLPKGKVPSSSSASTLGDDITHSLSAIKHSVVWLDRYLTPHFESGKHFDDSAAEYRGHLDTHTFLAEDSIYHSELRKAFTLAVDGDTTIGEQLAVEAEKVVFERVVLPFDRLFGQNKKPKHAGGFAEQAMTAFDDYLAAHARFALVDDDVASTQRARCHEVLRSTLQAINDVTAAARKRWKQSHVFWLQQSRLVWLPLNYGLRPEQYDTQTEWDAILAKLTDGRFSDANTITYLPNEQFHIELQKMIRDTEYYQVLLIHDFQGQHKKKKNETDLTGWSMVVDGYIGAFVDAIKAIDNGERRKIPQFFIFLDQFYYEATGSRQIMTYLENLYDAHAPRLENKDVEQKVIAAQQNLRKTIDASPTLQKLGEKELRDLFRVHVNITNPYDPAFSWDSPFRDHRKIAYRDVLDEDPSAGVGIVTGEGVGDHYSPPAWEDRGLMIEGPALEELKWATARLFVSQGYDPEQVPDYLKRRDRPANYDALCADLRDEGCSTSMLVAMNATGFGEKKATILKATLFNLAPPGSVLFSIDSLWLSDFWAGMFICAALRGAHMYPVAPSAENAPAGAAPIKYVMRQTLEMMLQARDYFAGALARAGGQIRVGIYTQHVPVDQHGQRIRLFLEKRSEYPFLREEFPLDSTVVAQLRAMASPQPAKDTGTRPFLHMKTNFFANEVAWRILSRPEWLPALQQYMTIRGAQSSGVSDARLTPQILRASRPDVAGGRDVITAFRQTLETDDTTDAPILTFLIGSHNMDRRGMLLDGEVLTATSGYDAMICMVDMVYLLGISEWPGSVAELDPVFPEQDAPGILQRFYLSLIDLF